MRGWQQTQGVAGPQGHARVVEQEQGWLVGLLLYFVYGGDQRQEIKSSLLG